MARIKQPDLPDGALKDFFVSLHNLHLKAGYPSTREIQKDIGRNVVSHTTIHKALSGPHLPGWGITELLIEVLARRSRLDEHSAVEDFRVLWENVAKGNPGDSGAGMEKVRHAAQEFLKNVEKPVARSFADLMIGTLDIIEVAGSREVRNELVPTGFSDVDTLTGGMRPGSLIVIGACPSIGKSTLMITLCATNALRYELPAGLFSFEMAEQEMLMRILSAESRVSHIALRSGMMSDDEWSRLARKMSEVADAPLWLSYSANMTAEDFEAQARALYVERKLRLLAVDNIDIMLNATENPIDVLYRLKSLAADLSVPILLTANMRKRRKGDIYERPHMDDLWHAEPIETVADIVILLNRPDYYEPESPRAGEIDLIFMKNRFGPTATIILAFQAHYCRIVDLFISEERGPDWSFKSNKSDKTESDDGGVSQ